MKTSTDLRSCTGILWFLLATSLTQAADTQPPAILSLNPPAGATVSSLSQIQVTFDEAVTGADANALWVNGVTATSVTGSSNRWVFSFPQPFPGSVSVGFALDHTITDLSGNRFDHRSALATWGYSLVDTVSPFVTAVLPVPGARVSQLAEVSVTFSEPVLGVSLLDLMVNNQPALSVSGEGVGPFVFKLPLQALGHLEVRWRSDNGIVDQAGEPNSFGGGSWSYTQVASVPQSEVVINEISAANVSGLVDEDGEPVDWIELWNPTDHEVSLLGWSLTDNLKDREAWVFPNVSVAAGGYRVVFASGKDRKPSPTGSLHTNFRLSGRGGVLALYDASSPRREIDALPNGYPDQRSDIAWGRLASGGFSYFASPTPGAANGVGSLYQGVVVPPAASVASGFFKDPITVFLSSETVGARIYYTLDGSVPTESSFRYLKPLTLTGTTNRAVVTLRAAAFRGGMLPSLATTHSYIYPELVLSQPAAPKGFPTTWVTLNNPEASASTSADYAMDQRVVTNKNNRELILRGFASMPTVSIVTAIPKLFGDNGVYSRRDSTNQQPIHIEMLLPDGSIAFRQDCGLEIQGGSSTTDANGDWKSKNLSMRLLFRGDFGPGKLKYPVYEGADVSEFDTLVLDSGLNMQWNHMTNDDQRNRAQGGAREQFINEMMFGTGILGERGRFVHLYLNGLYWGIKNLHERPDPSWASAHFGGAPEEYDILKHLGNTGGLKAGTITSYNKMLAAATKGTLSKNANYEALQQHLDLDWFIDYMLVNLWAANDDWDLHNWYAIRRRTPGAPGWRFVSWDAEHVIKDVTEDVTGVFNSAAPSDIFQSLRDNAEFRLRFADHVHRHFFNGGIFYTDLTNRNYNPLHPEWNRPAATYMSIIQRLDPAVVGESARWGDVARPAQPYTRDVEWLRELQSLLFLTNSPGNTVNYFPNRTANVLGVFRSGKQPLYPTVQAPSFNQHGGRVPAGFSLTLTTTSTPAIVYFTTNGADPRVYGSGAVSPQAFGYTPGSPFLLTRSLELKARTLSFGTNWSALNAATFTVEELGSPLRFSEIMYNTPGGDAFEFVEFLNTGDTTIDLSLASVEGLGFTFIPGALIPAGGTVVLASSVNTNAWKVRYPGIPIAGIYPGSLANGGEQLVLKDRNGLTLTSVTYNNGGGWPKSADGGGYSLELTRPNGDPSDPASWRGSSTLNGSPGLPTAMGVASRVILNEVYANGALNDPLHAAFLECLNTGDNSVDLTGWSFSNDANERKFLFPPGTLLLAHDFIVVYCNAETSPGIHSGFLLNPSGDRVQLYDNHLKRVDAVTFGNQLPDYGLGLIDGGWTLTVPSAGKSNEAARLASSSSLTINEWLANAAPGAEDWIEVFNKSSSLPLALEGLYLGTTARTVRLRYPAFVARGGFLRFFADERPGASHLDFKLAASGGSISLFDSTASLVERVDYGAAAQGVSMGRLPDGGSGPFFPFPGTASPGGANYQIVGGGAVVSEIMAVNRSAVAGPGGNYPDWVELFNPYATNLSLTGYQLVRTDSTERFLFPDGETLTPGSYRVIWCDGTRPASVLASTALNTGFSLPATGTTLSLLDSAGRSVWSAEFGFQITDRSIGRVGDTMRLLDHPTPGAANSAAALLGTSTQLRINEWMAHPTTGHGWFELYNRDVAPVALSGLWVTDDLSVYGKQNTGFAPLSFIDAHGFVWLVADSDPHQGGDHTRFTLDPSGGALRIYSSTFEVLDTVGFGNQDAGVSQGRFPDGADLLTRFFTSASPGESNWQPVPHLVISEVMSHGNPASADFMELENLSDQAIDVGGWFLSDRVEDLKRYSIGLGKVVPARGFLVLSATEFGGKFLLDSANDAAASNDELSDGDEVILSAANEAGELTGLRLRFSIGAAPVGVSLGRESTSIGDQLALRVSPTPGIANSRAAVGPVVVSELRLQDSQEPEEVAFVELQNVSTSSVSLSAPGSIGWRLRGGVDFDFTGSVGLLPRAFALIVGFDPIADSGKLAAFRARYALPTHVRILGPWQGGLHRGGESVRLERADGVQAALRPDAGKSVYVVIDAVEHSDASPWPDLGQPSVLSLQRRRMDGFANEPLNWFASAPTAGRANRSDSGFIDADHDGLPDDWEIAMGLDATKATDAELDPDGDGLTTWQEYSLGTDPKQTQSRATLPVLTQQPGSQSVGAGSNVELKVVASGEPALRYLWFMEGRPLVSATNAVLSLRDVQTDSIGDYFAVVSTDAGSLQSERASLNVIGAPNILEHPQSLAVDPGANAALKVVAETDHPPLSYQWRFNGADIIGANASTLNIASAQLAQEGDYAVQVSDPFARVSSQVARLTVKVKPIVTIQPNPTNQVVAAGSTASFSVTATGSLPMWFRWRRGVTTVTNIQLFSGTCVLTLPNLQTNQSGRYTVAVTNLAGGTTPQFSSGADLTVLLPPTITNPPISQITDVGGTAAFSVLAKGAAPLSYQWWFNSAPLSGATTSSLSLSGVQASQQGTYSVVVSNLVGQTTSSPATLSLRLPSVLSIRVDGGAVVVEWSAAPNLVYKLQSRTDLSSGDWSDVPGEVTSLGFKARKTIAVSAAGDVRYYRVVLMP